MKIKKFILLSVLAFFSTTSLAASVSGNISNIEIVNVHSCQGDSANIKIGSAWYYVPTNSSSYNAILSFALSAYHTQTSVNIAYGTEEHCGGLKLIHYINFG
jgi:hypothetical protein